MAPIVCLFPAVAGVAIAVATPDKPMFILGWPLALIGGATGLAQVFWDTSVRRDTGVVINVIAGFTPWIAIFSSSIFLGVGLVEHIQECALILGLAWLSMAIAVVSPRLDSADNQRPN